MCAPKAPPPPPPPVPAQAPPKMAILETSATATSPTKASRARDKLRIDKTVGGTGSTGSGLNIPT